MRLFIRDWSLDDRLLSSCSIMGFVDTGLRRAQKACSRWRRHAQRRDRLHPISRFWTGDVSMCVIKEI